MRLYLRASTTFTLGLVLATTLSAQGVQGHIRGRVTDAGSTPLVNVRITVVGSARSTLTGRFGGFVLDRIPAGTYTVRFESADHRPAEYRDIQIVGGTVHWLHVTLDEGRPEDPPSARSAGPTVDVAAPAQRYALTGAVVSELPAEFVRDVLAVMPGVAEAGALLGPSIRGTHAGEGVVLVNNVPVRSTRTGGFPLHVGLPMLAEVSVVPGAGTEFGDTHGGLVNLVTRAGGDELQANLRYSTDEPFGGGLSVAFNRFDGSVGGPAGGHLRFLVGGTLQGQLGAPRGEGVDNVPAYVMAGFDTTVAGVDIPRFAQFNGDCDPSENFGVACQGRRLPLEVATVASAVGRLGFTYGRGDVSFTTLIDMAQGRGWPGTLSFDPQAYQGVRTTGNLYALTWTHDLMRRGEEYLTLETSLSYQTESRTSGNLEPEWELAHRSPTAGIVLSPMRFVVDTDQFSSDTGAFAVASLNRSEHWDQLIENYIFDRGTRVPYYDRFDLGARGTPRVNPWGVVSTFPTTGLLTGPDNTMLARERRRWGKLALDWRPSRYHRVRVGGEVQADEVRYFAGGLTRLSGASAYVEEPSRFAAFATDRIDYGPVAFEVGLRWERYDSGARFPVVPGRIFTNPAFDPNDPVSLDLVFQPAEPHDVLLPSLALGYRISSATGVRVSYTRQARMPDMDAVMAHSNSDLADTDSRAGFGRDVDWVKSGLLEAGFRQRLGGTVLFDLAAYRRDLHSGLAFRIEPFFDPFTDRVSNLNVLTNADTGTVYGVEIVAQLRGTPWIGGQVGYSYQDAGDVSAATEVRAHTVAGFLVVRTPLGAGAGQWYGSVLRGLEAFARFRLASGRPYTRLANRGSGAMAPDGQLTFGLVEPLGASRLPWVKELDLRVVKQFRIGAIRWRAFADLRNVSGVANVQQLFAETGETQNDVHRRLFLDQELLSIEQEALASGAWVQVDRDGRVVDGVDLDRDCVAWLGAGGPAACVALQRAENRWGDGDGVYDVEEFTAALNALYELFYGRWTMLGPTRQVRVGMEVRF